MKFFNKTIELETKEQTRFYDISDEVNVIIKESKINNGHIIVQVMHTTVGIYLNEGEIRLLDDFVNFINRTVPNLPGYYRHDDIEKRDCPKDEPINGHSHIKSAFHSNPSVSLIIENGKMIVGQYQRILFAEFDGPCPRKLKSKRQIKVSIIGE